MPRKIYFIFLAFGLAIAGGSSFYYAWCWSEVLDGRAWPSTPGIIRSIGVEAHRSEDSRHHVSTTFYPRLAYSYRAGDRVLEGERIWLSGSQFFQRREDADAFVRGYAVGQRVPVRYAPDAPEESALLIEDPPWQILLFTAFGLVWIALAMWFRLAGRGPPKRRFGRCRSCGARLPFDGHVPVRAALPADMADKVPAPDGLPCPRCGQRDPLNSWRNRKGLIAFLVVFAAIWAVGLWALFLG